MSTPGNLGGLGRIPQPALGRIHIPDPRDKKFPLRAALPAKPIKPLPSRSWDVNWIGDQGDTSMCVAYSWYGFLRASPLRLRARSVPSLVDLYKGAQQNDDWPGESPAYEGSSVRGGAEFLLSKTNLTEYRWAHNIGDIVDWLSEKGPIVFGTNWYRDMFTPRGSLALVDATGPQDGGHAYLCYGYENHGELFKFVNSWGRKWGEFGGRFRMTGETVHRLLLAEDGEACVAIKRKVS